MSQFLYSPLEVCFLQVNIRVPCKKNSLTKRGDCNHSIQSLIPYNYMYKRLLWHHNATNLHCDITMPQIYTVTSQCHKPILWHHNATDIYCDITMPQQKQVIKMVSIYNWDFNNIFQMIFKMYLPFSV